MENHLKHHKERREKMKRITVCLEDDIYKKAKIKAVMEDKTLLKYIAELVRKDLQKEKE